MTPTFISIDAKTIVSKTLKSVILTVELSVVQFLKAISRPE